MPSKCNSKEIRTKFTSAFSMIRFLLKLNSDMNVGIPDIHKYELTR